MAGSTTTTSSWLLSRIWKLPLFSHISCSRTNKLPSAMTTDEVRDNDLSLLNLEDLSCEPDEAWEAIKDRQILIDIEPPNPDKMPITPDKVRFVCMSDTHTKTTELKYPVPPGDVFLHAGDFTRKGTVEEAEVFNEWLGTLPHRYKIVIAGNHELLLDKDASAVTKVASPDEVLTNATAYLQGSGTSVFDIRIYGCPWTPIYHVMAFNLSRGSPLRRKWESIPNDVDILMTHGPPLGRCDLSLKNKRSGCVDLLKTVQSRVKPKYHIFGHIHEGHGISYDGTTTYINAATCNVKYKPVNRAIVFDYPLPEGLCKEDFD
ncbi:metallophosphoesterase MPPED2-like isoform X1 [Macrobrachium rosenbergii]|uniref:metallophosphoesterase MPPED2-like isoform X1 n=2 Tax=Macrobrachium rosenbergii TaxID=79674 RepID=UPI0034D3ADCD